MTEIQSDRMKCVFSHSYKRQLRVLESGADLVIWGPWAKERNGALNIAIKKFQHTLIVSPC